jgi:hypothetical protein
MNRFITVLILSVLISSCRKTSSDFIWERTYGNGEAYFVKPASDSGIIASGEIEGKPYFIRLDKNRNKLIDFTSDGKGLISSLWFDTTCYIAGGNSGGKMLLMRIGKEGKIIWDTTLTSSFKVDYTNLIYSGNGEFLATGTACPDSAGSESAALLFVRFDIGGLITKRVEISSPGFVSANKIVEDKSGNIFLAITRLTTGTRSKAAVAGFNNQFQKLWETELYNNPDFGASSLDIQRDASGNIFVSGNTELSQKEGVLNNSFLASLTNTGSIRWKKYFEISNSGSSLIITDKDLLVMLNRNCFILNIVNPDDGSDAGRIKVLDVCNSKDGDAFGTDIDQMYNGNILISGSRGGKFYLALKSFVY